MHVNTDGIIKVTNKQTEIIVNSAADVPDLLPTVSTDLTLNNLREILDIQDLAIPEIPDIPGLNEVLEPSPIPSAGSPSTIYFSNQPPTHVSVSDVHVSDESSFTTPYQPQYEQLTDVKIQIYGKQSRSRQNMAWTMIKDMFNTQEKMSSNCRGVGKQQLDQSRCNIIKQGVFRWWPLKVGEDIDKVWRNCQTSIDAGLRNLRQKARKANPS